MLSRRFWSQPSGSRRLEQQERQQARLGAAAAPNALDRRKWSSFKRGLLWKSSEKAQADQGVAGCSAVWVDRIFSTVCVYL